MEFFSDLIRSLYDFKAMAQEFSRRGAGRVFLALLTLSLGYGIVTGVWYGNGLTDLAVIIAQEAKTQLPAFTIDRGALTSPVKQPYVVTEHTLSEAFFQNLSAWIKRRFHQNVPGTREAMLSWVDGERSRLFCLVLDTTGTYQEVVKPEEYQFYLVATKDSATFVGEAQGRGRNVRQVKFSETQRPDPINISPDLIRLDVVRQRISGSVRGWFATLGVAFTLARFALKAVFVGLLGLLLSTLMGKGFTFGRTFTIAVYALVPVVICGIVKVVAMPYPGILLFLIHLVYGLVPVALANPERQAAAS